MKLCCRIIFTVLSYCLYCTNLNLCTSNIIIRSGLDLDLHDFDGLRSILQATSHDVLERLKTKIGPYSSLCFEKILDAVLIRKGQYSCIFINRIPFCYRLVIDSWCWHEILILYIIVYVGCFELLRVQLLLLLLRKA